MKFLAFTLLFCISVTSAAYVDLNGAIEEENPQYEINRSPEFNFSRYHKLEVVVQLIKDLSSKYPSIAKLEVIGKSHEHRPIYNLKISSGDDSSKPAVILECGIHSNEWSSVAAASFIANKLVTTYGSDPEITALVDKYEFNILINVNPDGYVYAWTKDRKWKKNRSQSSLDVLGRCIGTDLSRNFDVRHCNVKNDRDPCDVKYCGDKSFSESETRAIRDLMKSKQDRLSVYFSIHGDVAAWLTPYAYSDVYRPVNWKEISQIAKVGVDAIKKFSNHRYDLEGYPHFFRYATGRPMDYAIDACDAKFAFELHLRHTDEWDEHEDSMILHVCQEAFVGIKAAIEAI